MFATPNDELHPEVKPLSKRETAWLIRLEKTLLACPTERLELATSGDAYLLAIDGNVTQEHDLEINDGQASRNGLLLATVESRPQISAISN